MKTWTEIINRELSKLYAKKIKRTIARYKEEGRTIYPEHKDIFRAFHLTKFNDVKVVIIGQDPYHNGHADGLAFSSRDTKRPASLNNICKEISVDVFNVQNVDDYVPLFVGNELECWAKQGVLLMNTTLTVEKGKPDSHSAIGWRELTKAVIKELLEDDSPKVFMLWGAKARKVFYEADPNGGEGSPHLILEAAHPSPFSANEGFFGCRHFSHANEFLESHHKAEIDWRITPSEEFKEKYKDTLEADERVSDAEVD